MNPIQERLLSRKFWLALAACVYFGLYRQFDSIAQVTIAYLAVNAAVEGFNSYLSSKEPSE